MPTLREAAMWETKWWMPRTTTFLEMLVVQCFILLPSFCVLVLVLSDLRTFCGSPGLVAFFAFPVQHACSVHWFGGRSLLCHNMLSTTACFGAPRKPCLLVSLGAWWPLTDHRDCSRSVLAIVLPGMDEPRPWFLIGKSGAGQAPRLICFVQTEQKQWALSLAPFPEVLFHRHDAFDNGIASGVAYKG